jgi:hypothetical protein
MNRLDTAEAAYVKAFGLLPPMPWGVNSEVIAEVLERAIVDGKPVPESFDWWAGFPPDAVA